MVLLTAGMIGDPIHVLSNHIVNHYHGCRLIHFKSVYSDQGLFSLSITSLSVHFKDRLFDVAVLYVTMETAVYFHHKQYTIIIFF